MCLLAGNDESNKMNCALILWFTGLSGAGKTTLAKSMQNKLGQYKIKTVLLDGDEIRNGLNKDLGFSREDRMENNRRIIEVSKLLASSGITALVSTISPTQKIREQARQACNQGVAPGKFIEIYVKCPLSVCERRDPKGLYKKARAGIIQNFTGISDPYEPPQKPDITIDTSTLTVEQSVIRIMSNIKAYLTSIEHLD